MVEVTQHGGKDELNPLWVICSKLWMSSDWYSLKHLNGRNRCDGTSVLVVEIALACIITLRAAVNLSLNKANPCIDVLNT